MKSFSISNAWRTLLSHPKSPRGQKQGIGLRTNRFLESRPRLSSSVNLCEDSNHVAFQICEKPHTVLRDESQTQANGQRTRVGFTVASRDLLSLRPSALMICSQCECPACNSDADSSERWLIVSVFSSSQGVLHKPSISFQSIIEGTKHFHKDFLIGEGEIFEVYRVEIQNQTYAVKLFKQVRTEFLSRISIPLICSYFILKCVIFH